MASVGWVKKGSMMKRNKTLGKEGEKEKKGGRKTKFLVMSLYLLFKRAPSK
jgi:hypothetical protein